MKLLKTIFLLGAFLLGSLSVSSAFAGVEVKSMDFKTSKDEGRIVISFDGRLKDYPELKVSKSVIQVVIPDAKVKREISKKVAFSSGAKDTSLNLGRFTGNNSRLKAVFPFDVAKHKSKIALMIKDNKIELNFPRVKVNAPSVKKAAAAKMPSTKQTAKSPKGAKREYLNEDYLNSLIKIDGKGKKVVEGKVIRPKMDNDEVKTTLAAPDRTSAGAGKSSFSLLEYGGKFVAFLAVVILMFYGIITMMKKGFIKKGKLGFLNKTEQIQVLSQTYIAPKKSLMMVRAHNQVFLVSNTDAGIHPISEIRDVAGYLKEGERKIAGDNFDINLGSAENEDALDDKVKLKEDITQSNKQSSLSDYMGVRDKVKFSDEIKKKVKNLKPLQ